MKLYSPTLLIFVLALTPFLTLTPSSASAEAGSVAAVFSERHETQTILEVEAALARAQAELGIIPAEAAEEITAKADARNTPADALATERDVVRHRMVALLNVWARSLEGDAAEYLHFGATTVDIYDTVLMLQLRDAGTLLLQDMFALEQVLMDLASKHRNTLMIGRTLGQHALPITFGKKVSTWLGENRRNINRLKAVMQRIEHSGILKGAVGSYLGFGPEGIVLEQRFATELGLGTPYPDDWHGSRDVIAEYALTWALISKSLGRIGNELFLLQMTDIGETEEVRTTGAVGSSTMPHKKNPSKPEALVHFSRTIPRLAEVLLDDVINVFERDNTSRPNRIAGELSQEASAMLRTASSLLKDLRVHPDTMLRNLQRTNGLIMAQRITFSLAEPMGKTSANAAMHEVALHAVEENITLREAIRDFPGISRHLSDKKLDELLDVTTYTGLAGEQVDAVIAWCEAARREDKAAGLLD